MDEDDDVELNPESADKFTWGADDLNVYGSEEEYRQAVIDREIAHTDKMLRAAGVDPANPEATLGDLDDD